MQSLVTSYKRHRFSPAIILRYAVWLYGRFNLSHRDIEGLLGLRGIVVNHESIQPWRNKFGPRHALGLRRRHGGYGSIPSLATTSNSMILNGFRESPADYSRPLMADPRTIGTRA